MTDEAKKLLRWCLNNMRAMSIAEADEDDVMACIAQHEADGKKFDRWCFLPAGAKHLLSLEQKYILA